MSIQSSYKSCSDNMQVKKKGYKQTEIGLIPEDWEVISVDKISKITTGDKDTQNKIADGKYPFFVRSQEIERINSYSFDGEAVLTSGDGVGVGKIFHYIKGKFDFHQRVYSIHDFNKYDGKFFYYYFSNHFFERVMQMTAKSSVDSVRREMISNMNIPLPPTLQEQQAIAQVLSDTDRCIESMQQLITKKKAIKQGAMQELLKGKKRLAGFDGEWETKKLGEIADINMGQSPLSMFYNNEGNGLPLIQGNADVKNRQTIIRSYTSYWPKNANKGDIIMTVRAPVGKIAKASFNCCIGRGVCSIIYKNDYLFFYLIFKENSWSKISTGSTFDSINSNQIKEVEINLPKDIQEQQAIAQILSDMDAEIEALSVQLHKTKALKQGLMQELLTGKTRLVKPKTYNEQDLKLNTAAEP